MTVFSLDGGGWRFREAGEREWLPAVVPGCVHTDLRRAGRIPDPFHGTNERLVQWIEERDWEYALEFSASADLLREDHVELVADGLDTVAEVKLNGHEVGRSESMFTGFRWDVRSRLKRGKNRLLVRFRSPMDYIRKTRTDFIPPKEFTDPVGLSVRIRKEQCSFGWDWGIRLATSGIWRSLRLEGWSVNRIRSVQVRQEHPSTGAPRLLVTPSSELPPVPGDRWRYTLRPANAAAGLGSSACPGPWTSEGDAPLVAEGAGLWWPAGQGAQALHELTVELVRGETVVDSWIRTIGLRSLRLVRESDEHGESFLFEVNGRPIFAKGSNWIPARAPVAGLQRTDYESLLRDAAAAHHNFIRVWGGGIYEADCFYELCDALGLLVWQDFMFACTLYPGDDAFAALVEQEARYQVERLRHHACLALWCGNNEIEQLNSKPEALGLPAYRQAYDRIFDQVLPGVVAEVDGVTAYLRSSESAGYLGTRDPYAPIQRGDRHYWDVWHARHPVSDYERTFPRFCSEFGMQSYASAELTRTFCPAEALNIFSPEMENHQRCPGGNATLFHYIAQRYRYPKDYAALAYLSQLNQAHTMRVGTEHYRRLQPRCMGALYWQLNDNWPVHSWSSIEYGGAWKALHHESRRFLGPVLVSARYDGTDSVGNANFRISDVRGVLLAVVCDAPEGCAGKVWWRLMTVDGKRVRQGTRRVHLGYLGKTDLPPLDFSREFAKFGRTKLVLSYGFEPVSGPALPSEGLTLDLPRAMELPQGRAQVRSAPDGRTVRLSSPCYLHRVRLIAPGARGEFSDNFIDLFPGEVREVTWLGARPLTAAQRKRLTTYSLRDTY